MSMNFIYEAGAKDVPMHIQKTDNAGNPKMEVLCGANCDFNRTINAPWTLGNGICADCRGSLK